MITNRNVKRVRELYADFQQRDLGSDARTGQLHFQNVGDQDVYNPTAPFASAGKVVLAGRVEPRDQERSKVVFFEQTGDSWFPIKSAPTFDLQDPFVTVVQGELIFGGVRIHEVGSRLEWATIFYRGKDIFSLAEFFCGPTGMKDIRLCDRQNGRIAVFTRPQGKVGGRGTIGYMEIGRVDELTTDIIASAQLLQPMVHALDWTGVNEAHLLPNGEIGLLSHVSCFENDDMHGELHYYAASFIFDPDSRRFRDLGIIASRDQFESGPAKRAKLADVVFPSGLIRANGIATLFAGVSDAEVHWLEIADPFSALER
jgi:hypothetical protein